MMVRVIELSSTSKESQGILFALYSLIDKSCTGLAGLKNREFISIKNRVWSQKTVDTSRFFTLAYFKYLPFNCFSKFHFNENFRILRRNFFGNILKLAPFGLKKFFDSD
jgi:hypothetical protein